MVQTRALQAFGFGWVLAAALTFTDRANAAERWVGGGTCRAFSGINDLMRPEENTMFNVHASGQVATCAVASDSKVKMWDATNVHVTGNCGMTSGATQARLCRRDWGGGYGSGFICAGAVLTSCSSFAAYDLAFSGTSFLHPWTVNGGYGYPYVEVNLHYGALVSGIYITTSNP